MWRNRREVNWVIQEIIIIIMIIMTLITIIIIIMILITIIIIMNNNKTLRSGLYLTDSLMNLNFETLEAGFGLILILQSSSMFFDCLTDIIS